jgi:hypothetical protein
LKVSYRSPRSPGKSRLSMKPGAMQFTRILCGASSRAWLIVSRLSAAFIEP